MDAWHWGVWVSGRNPLSHCRPSEWLKPRHGLPGLSLSVPADVRFSPSCMDPRSYILVWIVVGVMGGTQQGHQTANEPPFAFVPPPSPRAHAFFFFAVERWSAVSYVSLVCVVSFSVSVKPGARGATSAISVVNPRSLASRPLPQPSPGHDSTRVVPGASVCAVSSPSLAHWSPSRPPSTSNGRPQLSHELT